MSNGTTPASATGSLLSAILSAVKNDALKLALPIVSAFFTNIAANPDRLNILAQLAALQVNLLAALPNIEAALVKDIAAMLQAEIATLTATVKP